MTEYHPSGLFDGISNAVYHDDPAIGSSGLVLLERSPKHYFQQYRTARSGERHSTPAQIIGSAWHCALFEPDEFESRYVRVPDGIDKRTKEGKALFAEIEGSGRTPLKPGDFEGVEDMVRAVRATPAGRVIFERCKGRAEVSIFWRDPDTGVHLKIRPDYLIEPCDLFPNGMSIDGKSTEDASDEGFGKSIASYAMHYQAALYTDGIRHHFGTKGDPNFLWLACEKSAPFESSPFIASSDLVEYGRLLIRQRLRTLAECEASGVWPGYGSQTRAPRLPIWYEREILATVGER